MYEENHYEELYYEIWMMVDIPQIKYSNPNDN